MIDKDRSKSLTIISLGAGVQSSAMALMAAKGELPTTFRAYEEGSTEVFKDTATQHGFIAQEVKAAMDADAGIQDGFKMWSERADGSQEVGDVALIPILVKAIQELSTQNAALAARLTALEA